jgi:hypothetical protein
MSGDSGQASVELLGGALAMLLAGLIGLQVLGAGYGAVMADHAAEAAALAIFNGRPPETAVRTAVPGWPDGAIGVDRTGDLVRVRLRAPSLLRSLRGRLTFEGTARLPGAEVRP